MKIQNIDITVMHSFLTGHTTYKLNIFQFYCSMHNILLINFYLKKLQNE